MGNLNAGCIRNYKQRSRAADQPKANSSIECENECTAREKFERRSDSLYRCLRVFVQIPNWIWALRSAISSDSIECDALGLKVFFSTREHLDNLDHFFSYRLPPPPGYWPTPILRWLSDRTKNKWKRRASLCTVSTRWTQIFTAGFCFSLRPSNSISCETRADVAVRSIPL